MRRRIQAQSGLWKGPKYAFPDSDDDLSKAMDRDEAATSPGSQTTDSLHRESPRALRACPIISSATDGPQKPDRARNDSAAAPVDESQSPTQQSSSGVVTEKSNHALEQPESVSAECPEHFAIQSSFREELSDGPMTEIPDGSPSNAQTLSAGPSEELISPGQQHGASITSSDLGRNDPSLNPYARERPLNIDSYQASTRRYPAKPRTPKDSACYTEETSPQPDGCNKRSSRVFKDRLSQIFTFGEGDNAADPAVEGENADGSPAYTAPPSTSTKRASMFSTHRLSSIFTSGQQENGAHAFPEQSGMADQTPVLEDNRKSTTSSPSTPIYNSYVAPSSEPSAPAADMPPPSLPRTSRLRSIRNSVVGLPSSLKQIAGKKRLATKMVTRLWRTFSLSPRPRGSRRSSRPCTLLCRAIRARLLPVRRLSPRLLGPQMLDRLLLALAPLVPRLLAPWSATRRRGIPPSWVLSIPACVSSKLPKETTRSGGREVLYRVLRRRGMIVRIGRVRRRGSLGFS